MPECFFAHLGGCEGQLVRAHLIPKSRMRRHFKYELKMSPDEIERAIWDERCWVPMCGGITGCSGHHGRLDGRQITLNRVELPTAVKEFAHEYGLEWSLERDYES